MFENLLLISVVLRKLSLLSLPVLLNGPDLVSDTTTRLSKVTDSSFHSDPTCSVPGRTIFSVHFSAIELTSECAILVNLDQEKTLDRVNPTFIFDVLRSYGFGPDFCHWISTFCDSAFGKIRLDELFIRRYKAGQKSLLF